MNLKAICSLTMCLTFVGTALATDKTDIGYGSEPVREDCPLDGYDVYTIEQQAAIPDDDPDGVLIGPIETAPGGTIGDVIWGVDLEHTYTGDLRVWLYYDIDCDAVPDIGPVAGLCRAGLDGCEASDCCGCSGDLGGYYYFSDDASDPLGEFDCPDALAPGCYQTAIDSPDPLSLFDGEATGGCFWVFVADGAGLDTGTVFGATVALETGGSTPVEGVTWGEIKSTY